LRHVKKHQNVKKHQRANSRFIQAEKQQVQGKELTSGTDKQLNRRAQRFLARLYDEKLIEKLITNLIIHASVALIWLLFLWIAVRLFLR
jgi:hypothetical protein